MGLKDFIKRDCTKSVIEITLRNEGPDSYKEEKYGNAITFQRTIRDNGQTALVLKDNEGISYLSGKAAKEEGKLILNHFQIDVENPIIVLQQDEAKEMLRVETPDKLYEFFVSATLIKQIKSEYTKADHQKRQILDNVEKMEAFVKELK